MPEEAAKEWFALEQRHIENIARFVTFDRRWRMEEQFGFLLDNIGPLPFMPCIGRQRWFEVDYKELTE
jgi:hypothetical protein